MSIKFDKSVTERIKEACNIVDVVSFYMPLQKSGNNYWGLCPFHNEKTPSFSVSEDRQSYHCFGCGEGGDVFSFVMHKEHCDFLEAVRILGAKAGIDVDIDAAENKAEEAKKKRMYELNRMAAKFYLESLRNAPAAISYLKHRGLSAESLQHFGLGYAADEWSRLLQYMKKHSVTEEELLEVGLIKRSENGKYYDGFRNRIIFPLVDIKDRVVGFGGRAIGEEKPKYLNSAENQIFHKRNFLFGLNLVKKYSDKSYIVLVEGYMDVIAFFSKGIQRAVASMGTALTEDQVRQIAKYGKEIYICYDTDEAGRKATERAIDIFIRYGYSPRIITLPMGKDPDDYFKEHGMEDFEQLLLQSDTHYEFRKSFLSKKYDLEKPDEKTRMVQELNSYISNIKNPIEREVYIDKLAEDMKISPQVLMNTKEKDYRAERKNPFVLTSQNIRQDMEYEIIKFSLLDKEMYEEVKALLPDYKFENKKLGEIYEIVGVFYQNGETIDKTELYKQLLEKDGKYTKQLSELIFDNADFFVVDEREMLNMLKNKVKKVSYQEQREDLLKKIQELQQSETKDSTYDDQISELCNQLMILNRELNLSQDN